MDNYTYLRKSGLFHKQVPRYTSYPSANHFTHDVGQAEQKAWLQAVPDGSAFSLYIHIPFCKRICWFCACRTQGTKTLRPVEAYIETLLKELEQIKKTMPDDVRMKRLHLGGGTPTILSTSLMEKLLDRVFGTFRQANDLEFSVEIDPTEVTKPLIKVLSRFGLNRVSIGVQDFDPRVQKAIGREQSFQQTKQVIDWSREEGVSSLNLDLLYGLPHQTKSSLLATLRDVSLLDPDRIALYGYAHVPWMAKRQVMIDAKALADGEARFGLAQLAQNYLSEEGYTQIGIDHFAKPDDSLAQAARKGKLRRNFQGYTDEPSQILIGLGASAISRFAQGYTQNASATFAYQQHIQANRLAGARGYQLTQNDRVHGAMIESLMCYFSLDKNSLTKAFPDFIEQINAAIQSLVKEYGPYLEDIGGQLKITDEARPMVRLIANAIDEFSRSPTGHSTAI